MRRSAEVLVARLRNRKSRIVIYGIICVVLLVAVPIHWYMFFTLFFDLVPKEGDNLQPHVALGQPLIVGITCMQTMAFFLTMCLAAAVGALINELTTFTKTDLLVSLWDRVQALEETAKQKE